MKLTSEHGEKCHATQPPIFLSLRGELGMCGRGLVHSILLFFIKKSTISGS